MSSGYKKYFFNTSWLMAERLFRMGAALFVGVYVARYLGPNRYGVLSYAVSFVWLFMSVATLGLDGIVVRELVKMPEHRDEILGTAFWLKIVGAILMWIMIATVLPLTGNDVPTNGLIVIIAFAAIFQAFNVIDFNFQAEVKSKYVVYAQLVQLVISSIIKLSLIAIEAPLIWFACVYCLDAMVLALGLFVMYLRSIGKFWCWQWKWQVARTLLKDSWPLMLSGFMILIYMKIDQVMIMEMLGSEEVGLYAAAVRLSEAWYFIPVAITSSFFPAIVNAKKQGKERYYQQLQKLYNLIPWIAIPITIAMFLLSDFILIRLYGDAFLKSVEVFSVLMISYVFVCYGVLLGKWLVVENNNLQNLIRTSLGSLLNVVGNYFLITPLGIKGAAIATLISYFYVSIGHVIFLKDRQKIFYLMRKSLSARWV